MDLMAARRRLMQMQVLDTSPKIAENGVVCESGSTGTRVSEDGCVTIYYTPKLKPSGISTSIVDNFSDRNNYPYQFEKSNGELDWWFRSSLDAFSKRRIIASVDVTLKTIRFSLPVSTIQDCAAYCDETGEIFFAGKNTIYYGHRNISEIS